MLELMVDEPIFIGFKAGRALRQLLESLGKLLIAQEVVDRHALTQLLGTALPEEAPYAPGGPDRAEDKEDALCRNGLQRV